MVTVTVVCILMTIMAFVAMLMMNKQILILQEEINEMYHNQSRYDSRIENCEEILLDTAKRTHKHEQQIGNLTNNATVMKRDLLKLKEGSIYGIQ